MSESKIKCVLIEDERPAYEIFSSFISKFPNFEFKAWFQDVFEAQEYLNNHQVDVIFLDIQLPGMTGIEFLESLRSNPLVIITSAYEEHALKAFELRVFDYLLKPFSISRFNSSIQRIVNHLKPKNNEIERIKVIEIKSGYDRYKINPSEIKFLESKKELVEFNLIDGNKITSRFSMEEVMKLLGNDNFIRIHRSFIVPKHRVRALGSSELIFEDFKLPIGRSYKSHVENFWKKS